MDDDMQDIFTRIGMRPFEVFYYVVELGGFSQAAEELNLSQPTVSQHVKNLEETLGDKLLIRGKSGLSLTPIGEICFDKMRELQTVRDDLEESLKSYHQASQRELIMGASTIPGEFLLPRVLPDFLGGHENITVQIEIDESSAVLEQLEQGTLRWGLTGTDPSTSELSSRALIVEEMKLVGTPEFNRGAPLNSLEDLREQPYVGRRAQSGTRKAVEEYLRENGVNPEECLDPVARLGTVQSVREAVVNGLGVSFLPEAVVRQDLRENRLEVIESDFGSIERIFYGVENRFLGVSPLVETFRNYLIDHESLRVVESP